MILGCLLSCVPYDDKNHCRSENLTPFEVENLVVRTEKAIGLPQGTVKTGLRRYDNHWLPDVRAAIAVYVQFHSKIPRWVLAPMLGLKTPGGASLAQKTGRGYLETGDEQFCRYYTIVQHAAS